MKEKLVSHMVGKEVTNKYSNSSLLNIQSIVNEKYSIGERRNKIIEHNLILQSQRKKFMKSIEIIVSNEGR